MLQSNCNNVWANRYHVALDTVFAHTDLYKHCIPTLGHIHSLINKTVFPKGLRWHTADHNFQFSILHFQLKKNLPNTANAIFGRIFYLFTYSLCTSFSQNYSASGRLASFSRWAYLSAATFSAFSKSFSALSGNERVSEL